MRKRSDFEKHPIVRNSDLLLAIMLAALGLWSIRHASRPAEIFNELFERIERLRPRIIRIARR
jgi:hypothetical protein